MLFDIYDEQTGERSRYLVDRETYMCIILKWVPQHIEKIVAQCEALGVPNIRMFIVTGATQTIESLEEVGWKVSDLIVLERIRDGKGGLR